ncbi:MAG: radical SAM/SPASM domain-containing protein [Bacteroidota bacterium]
MSTISYTFWYGWAFVRSLSLARIRNLVHLRITFILSRVLKKHIFSSFPSSVSIEPTNTCNLQCPECPTGNKTSAIQKGCMSKETFERILAEVKTHTFFINLYFQGEPFLHPDMCLFISRAHQLHMMSSTSTNAHYITEKNAEDIVRSGLTHIIVSLDGFDQQSYEVYRKKGDFNAVVSGLQVLSTAKQKLKSKYPLIEVQCLLFKHTEQHKQELQELGYNNGADKVVFKTAQFYSAENMYMMPVQKNNSRYIFNQEKQTLELRKKPKNKCWRMWSSVVFTWNGTVLPCCFDKYNSYAYGTIEQSSLQSILTSKQARRFKQQVHTNRTVFSICRNCTS